MMYIQLFLSFFQISLFSFGGGYAALPLIQGQVVNVHHWLSMTEFTDLITISQMTPGPIAINAATFVGMKLTGMPGAVVATLGYITPSCIIVTDHCKIVLKIPGNGHATGNTWRDQTGGGRTDRIGGNFHFADQHSGEFPGNGDI